MEPPKRKNPDRRCRGLVKEQWVTCGGKTAATRQLTPALWHCHDITSAQHRPIFERSTTLGTQNPDFASAFRVERSKRSRPRRTPNYADSSCRSIGTPEPPKTAIPGCLFGGVRSTAFPRGGTLERSTANGRIDLIGHASVFARQITAAPAARSTPRQHEAPPHDGWRSDKPNICEQNCAHRRSAKCQEARWKHGQANRARQCCRQTAQRRGLPADASATTRRASYSVVASGRRPSAAALRHAHRRRRQGFMRTDSSSLSVRDKL
jgi:hypothetical protein